MVNFIQGVTQLPKNLKNTTRGYSIFQVTKICIKGYSIITNGEVCIRGYSIIKKACEGVINYLNYQT